MKSRRAGVWLAALIGVCALSSCAVVKPVSLQQEMARHPAGLRRWRATQGYFNSQGEYVRLRGQVRLAGDALEFRATGNQANPSNPMLEPYLTAPASSSVPRDSVKTLVLQRSRAGLFLGAFGIGLLLPIALVLTISVAAALSAP